MTLLAKKKGSNIQRKNIKPQTSLYHSLGDKSKDESNQPTEHVNSFTFTTIGMFAGLIIGLLLDEISWGFGIGLLLGAIIDIILNYRNKKAFERKFGILDKTSTE